MVTAPAQDLGDLGWTSHFAAVFLCHLSLSAVVILAFLHRVGCKSKYIKDWEALRCCGKAPAEQESVHLQISAAQRVDKSSLKYIVFNISLFLSQPKDFEPSLAGKETFLVRS